MELRCLDGQTNEDFSCSSSDRLLCTNASANNWKSYLLRSQTDLNKWFLDMKIQWPKATVHWFRALNWRAGVFVCIVINKICLKSVMILVHLFLKRVLAYSHSFCWSSKSCTIHSLWLIRDCSVMTSIKMNMLTHHRIWFRLCQTNIMDFLSFECGYFDEPHVWPRSLHTMQYAWTR